MGEMGKTMTNYNERLDEALCNYRGRVLTYHELYRKQHHSPRRLDEDLAHADAVAKQALTSLIKELVAEAKPEIPVATSWQQGIEKKAFEDAIRVYEYKLLKALEEVNEL